jgi:hypothetical protein
VDDDSEARESLTPQLRAMRAANERRKAQGLPIGRPKGTPNKLTAVMRNGLLHVYRALGGDEGFERWARKHPGQFYALMAKGTPREREANALGTGVTVILSSIAEMRAEAERAVAAERAVIDATPASVADGESVP